MSRITNQSENKKCPFCKKIINDETSINHNNSNSSGDINNVEKFAPFCSVRCKQLDLGKWLNESYTIPGSPVASYTDEEEVASE